MEPSARDILELFELLNQTLDDPLPKGRQDRLTHLLEHTPELRPYYVNFFLLSSELRSCLGVSASDFPGPDLNLHIPTPGTPVQGGRPQDTERVNAIRRRAEQQLQAFLAEQEDLFAESWPKVRPPRRPAWDLRAMAKKTDALLCFAGRSLIVLAVCAALILMLVPLVSYVRANQVVAFLGDSVHAQWAVPPQGSELRPGAMSLEQGFVQLTFKKGAKVLLQAPCRFTLRSPSRMYLEEGSVTAKVPTQAVGFTVETRNSSIKDFGTEFGVSVNPALRTEVHVFRGLVQLIAAGQPRSGRNHWDLPQGRAARIDNHGNLAIGSVLDRPNLFVRILPPATETGIPGKYLDLADIVGGGNGLGTGIQDQGLDPGSGASLAGQIEIHAVAGAFQETPGYELIDGVFVPDSNQGIPLQISSTGLQFNGCPDTSGLCLHIIRNGTRFQQKPNAAHPGRLDGQTYGIPGHPAIEMHANAGITFDLDRIRAAHPGTRIERFQSLCGVSQTVADYSDGLWQSQRIAVGFRVLVDGRVRFAKDLFAVPSEPERVDIELSETDRFLTLITTECHPDRPFAWSLFAEPVLELALENP